MAVFGAGLRFNNSRMAVVPSLSVPFAVESSDVAFQVNLTSSF